MSPNSNPNRGPNRGPSSNSLIRHPDPTEFGLCGHQLISAALVAYAGNGSMSSLPHRPNSADIELLAEYLYRYQSVPYKASNTNGAGFSETSLVRRLPNSTPPGQSVIVLPRALINSEAIPRQISEALLGFLPGPLHEALPLGAGNEPSNQPNQKLAAATGTKAGERLNPYVWPPKVMKLIAKANSYSPQANVLVEFSGRADSVLGFWKDIAAANFQNGQTNGQAGQAEQMRDALFWAVDVAHPYRRQKAYKEIPSLAAANKSKQAKQTKQTNQAGLPYIGKFLPGPYPTPWGFGSAVRDRSEKDVEIFGRHSLKASISSSTSLPYEMVYALETELRALAAGRTKTSLDYTLNRGLELFLNQNQPISQASLIEQIRLLRPYYSQTQAQNQTQAQANKRRMPSDQIRDRLIRAVSLAAPRGSSNPAEQQFRSPIQILSNRYHPAKLNPARKIRWASPAYLNQTQWRLLAAASAASAATPSSPPKRDPQKDNFAASRCRYNKTIDGYTAIIPFSRSLEFDLLARSYGFAPRDIIVAAILNMFELAFMDYAGPRAQYFKKNGQWLMATDPEWLAAEGRIKEFQQNYPYIWHYLNQCWPQDDVWHTFVNTHNQQAFAIPASATMQYDVGPEALSARVPLSYLISGRNGVPVDFPVVLQPSEDILTYYYIAYNYLVDFNWRPEYDPIVSSLPYVSETIDRGDTTASRAKELEPAIKSLPDLGLPSGPPVPDPTIKERPAVATIIAAPAPVPTPPPSPQQQQQPSAGLAEFFTASKKVAIPEPAPIRLGRFGTPIPEVPGIEVPSYYIDVINMVLARQVPREYIPALQAFAEAEEAAEEATKKTYLDEL